MDESHPPSPTQNPGKSLLNGWLSALRRLFFWRPVRGVEAPVAPQVLRDDLLMISDSGTATFSILENLVAAICEAETDCRVLINGRMPDMPPDTQQDIEHAPFSNGSRTKAKRYIEAWKPSKALFFLSSFNEELADAVAATGAQLYFICDQVPNTVSRRIIQHTTSVFAAGTGQVRELRRAGFDDSRILLVGSLADTAPPPAWDSSQVAVISQSMAGRPMWLALGATQEEIETIIAAHSKAARLAHRLLLLLAPADPDDATLLEGALRDGGWRVGRRSTDDMPDAETQVFLLDVPQEEGLWCRLSPITLVGSTLAAPDYPKTEPDPMLPAALGSAILFGPRSRRFVRRYRTLAEADAARQVYDRESLARALEALIAPDNAAKLAHNAWAVATDGAEATHRVVSVLASRPRRERHE